MWRDHQRETHRRAAQQVGIGFDAQFTNAVQRAAAAEIDRSERFACGQNAPLAGLRVVPGPESQRRHDQAEGVALGARTAIDQQNPLLGKGFATRAGGRKGGMQAWLHSPSLTGNA